MATIEAGIAFEKQKILNPAGEKKDRKVMGTPIDWASSRPQEPELVLPIVFS